MPKTKESFFYSSQSFVQNNGNAKMDKIEIKNGKGKEITKTYQNGKLKSSKQKTLKSNDINKLRNKNEFTQVPLVLPLFGGIRTRRYKHSRSKTHKKRRS
uniref:Uncharacterized protein n=1 Tax=viral metagenome TaxID=1070528 RepID=A0A6C0D2S8_9ZZZZ